MTAGGERWLAWSTVALFGLAVTAQLAMGWTHALPVVDCYGWLTQVTADPRVVGHLPPSFHLLGMTPGAFFEQVGRFYAATGRAYISYLAYIQTVARIAAMDAALWHVANVLCVTAALALLWSTLRRMNARPWFSLVLVALLFAPHSVPGGWDVFGYMTSAEAPGLLYLAFALRFSLVPGLGGAVLCTVGFAAAALSKESLVAFAPLLAGLRWGAIERQGWKRLLAAALPAAVALTFMASFLLLVRHLHPPIGSAYVGAVAAAERSSISSSLAVGALHLLQQFLPSTTAADTPRAIVVAVGLRVALLAALSWLLRAFGWRFIGLRQLQPQHAAVMVASALAVAATLAAYWLLGRAPPADFHVAPAAFGIALGAGCASRFWQPTAAQRPLMWPFLLVLLLTTACAAQGARLGLYGTLAAAALGIAAAAFTPQHLERAVVLALVATLWLPRWPGLAADRAAAASSAEQLQAAVTRMVAQPKDATVHLNLARPAWIEYAWALRGYATLSGRSDLRLCLHIDDKQYSAGNPGYVQRLVAAIAADDAHRPPTAPTLTVAVQPDPVTMRPIVSTAPGTPCSAL